MAAKSGMRSPRIAVDTNFIIDLSDGDDNALSAFELIRERCLTPRFIIPPTAVQELAYLADYGDPIELRELAEQAAHDAVDRFSFSPQDLESYEHGIAEQIVRQLRDVLPEGERNDGFILAESCLLRCIILVTNDGDLANADPERIQSILEPFGTVPVIVTPRTVRRAFGG